MNEPPITDRQLVQATSRSLPPDAALDAETAALREGFLRLGSAVEASGGEFDEAAFLARLQAGGVGKASAAPAVVAALPPWLPLILTGALAASAVVAIARTVSVWMPAPVAVTAPVPDGNEPASNDLAAGGVTGRSPAAEWSDPLDEEIATAQDAFERIHRRPRDLDGSLESFGSRLEALAAELESGSL